MSGTGTKTSFTVDCKTVDESYCKWANGKAKDVPTSLKTATKALTADQLKKVKQDVLNCKVCKSIKSGNHALLIALCIGGGVLLIASIFIFVKMSKK